MTLSRVNFLVPFESAPAGHENQLTRALLVVLRYSPMAHQAWLGLVAPEQRLHDLSKAEFATQRQRVLGTETDLPDVEAVPGISVWLAPDAAPVNAAIEPSDRLNLFAKRLERGRFVWPQAQSGTVSLTAAQLSMLLEGIDWRRPQRTWQPEVAA